jgi:MFS family permease
MKKQKSVLLFTVFLDMLCFSMVMPVMPYLIKEFELPDIFAGIIIAVFALMNFICSPLWGGMSDRKGRRPVMLSSIAITMFGNVLLAFATNLPLLFLARILAGIGSANLSVAQACMVDLSEPHERTKNLGQIGAMFFAGFIIGPYIGTQLKSLSADGTAFYLGITTAMLNLANLIFAWYFLKETNSTLVPDDKRMFNPLRHIYQWLKKPVISSLIWYFFLYIIAFSMMQVTCTLLWKDKYGLGVKAAGKLFTLIGLLSALFQGLIVGPLSKRYSHSTLVIAGSIITAFSICILPFPQPSDFSPWGYVICGILALGNSLIMPVISSWLTMEAPESETGRVLSANQSFSALSRVIGPTLGTILYSQTQNLPFYTSGLLMLIPLGIVIRLKKN